MRPGWCPGCMRWCPGWDAEGFCLLLDWSDPRFRRPEAAVVAPVPEPVRSDREALHRHHADFPRYRVLLDGEELEHVWWACVSNEFAGGLGTVQLAVPGEAACRHRKGVVEIRLREPAAFVAPVAVITPLPVPAQPSPAKPRRSGASGTVQLALWEDGG